jgi:hypothetical protein
MMKLSASRFSKSVAVLCAACAICATSTVLRAQALSGSTATVSSGDIVPDSSVRLTNPYYTYSNFELWDPARWAANKAKVTPITTWIETHEKDTAADYVVKNKYKGIKDFVGNPDYTWKTESITDPDVMEPLARMGLRVDIREGGGVQIFVAPEKVLADKANKVPVLVVPHVLDKKDVFWAMNTLVHFRKYNELCAQRGDFIIVYVVMDKSAAGRGSPFGTVIDEATDVYRGDYKRLYLDMSVFKDSGTKVADIPGLDWTDDEAARRNPDAQIEQLGFIPVLNVAGKWNAKPSAGIGIARPRSDLRYDPQRIVHGKLGEHWMEGISFLYDHGKNNDPAIKTHFAQMGLVVGENNYQGERWIIFSPRQAIEQGKNLPLVLVLSEVYPYDEYSISTAYADYLDYFKLAAEGDLNLLLFAHESPETMDTAYDIIKEAEKTYPIDPSRIYVTGHSHNGHLSREFAYRHPDMVAAVAPLGNSSGLAAPAYSHEAVIADDNRIEAWSKIDMPIITIGAASEVTSPHTMPSSILNDYDLYIEAWQRRLKASRCPMKTRDQIMAAEHSGDYVTRLFGLPNDGSSLEVIDGVEHYIIDVKNVDGRKHLRIVGIENMVHTTEPTMPMVAWTFMRRFARDQKTGKVIELY